MRPQPGTGDHLHLPPSSPLQPAPETTTPRRRMDRRAAALLILALLVAAGWRLFMAASMPCIARDGVRYCGLAQMLANDGIAALRDARFEQHPLYPAALLGAERLFATLGAADQPMTWQRAGQSVALLSGMAVVALVAALTFAISRGVAAPVAALTAAACGAWLAALLPLNIWLSADVMSDQLSAALIVLGALLLTRLAGVQMALYCGLTSGLAFVTRPEGGIILVAGMIVLASQWRDGLLRFLQRGATLGAGFLLMTAPYWALSGQLSPKSDKERVEEFVPAATVEPHSQHGALTRTRVSWAEAALIALYQSGRAARVSVALLAIPALLHLRRSWAAPAMLGPLAVVVLHFCLMTALQARHGYLDPRHALPLVLLLTPFAGMFLGCAWEQASRRGGLWAAVLITGASLAPLVAYSTRVPNSPDAGLPRLAEWLQSAEPLRPEMRLLAGASERRIGFYAGLTPHPWAENLPTVEERVADLTRELLESGAGYRPSFFAIETGVDDERRANAEIFQLLQRSVAGAVSLELLRSVPRPGGETRLYRVHYASAAPH